MSLGSSDKELTSTFKRLSITIEITPINNKNNIKILTQNVFDAIDFKRLKKKSWPCVNIWPYRKDGKSGSW